MERPGDRLGQWRKVNRGTRNESRLRLQPDRKYEKLTFHVEEGKQKGGRAKELFLGQRLHQSSASDSSDHFTLPQNFYF